MKKICVFAGSKPGNLPQYIEASEALGKEFLNNGIDLVYGGSQIGLMGKLADTVLLGGGKAIGVMPMDLFISEKRHLELTEFYETTGMHERKAKMYELSDAFIALPGGFGTYEEIFEIVSWFQIGIHQKPIGLLNVNGFYDPLVEMVKKSIEAGFIRETQLGSIVVEEDPAVMLEKLRTFEHL